MEILDRGLHFLEGSRGGKSQILYNVEVGVYVNFTIREGERDLPPGVILKERVAPHSDCKRSRALTLDVPGKEEQFTIGFGREGVLYLQGSKRRGTGEWGRRK